MTIPIERKRDQAYLGQFLLKQRDTHTIEIGLDLMEQYQSKGIGTEVTALLLADIHRRYPNDMVIAKAYPNNVRSNRLIQHLDGVKMWEEPTEYEAALAVLHRVSEETGIEMPDVNDIISEGHINVYRL